MKTAKDTLMEHIDCEMKRLERLTNTANALPINLFVEAFPAGRWSTNWFDVVINFPFDFALIEQVKKFIIEQGGVIWYENRFVWNDQGKAVHFLTIFMNGVSFDINFRTENKGSTCVLNKIGEETKVLPIYEVICSEGEKEEVTVPVSEIPSSRI